jgi:hypothetical protein
LKSAIRFWRVAIKYPPIQIPVQQFQLVQSRRNILHVTAPDAIGGPPYDVAEITALAAATVVWEYLSLISFGQGEQRG